MQVDNYGCVSLNEKEIFDNLYSGNLKSLDVIYTDRSIAEKFNLSRNKNKDNFEEIREYVNPTQSIIEFDKLNQTQWFIPKNFKSNLIEMIYSLCKTEEEIARVNEELELFDKHNMLDLLFYLKYLVDTMRENNIIWGVGRGSSVSSYVLYLIGVHKINSLKYNLDIHEFLK